MSSNIMAQHYNVTDFDLIFAGVQKNLGPAGVALVIVKKSLIKKVDHIPSVFNYQLFAKKNSMPNTPPVFNIYATGLTLKWLKQMGGIEAMETLNQKKASLLYDFLDQSDLFSNPVKHEDRSLTNAVYDKRSEIDQAVIDDLTAQSINLKGHPVLAVYRPVYTTPCHLKASKHGQRTLSF